MPTTTLTASDIFPVGTSVTAYLRGSWPMHLTEPTGAPDPELLGTAEIQTVTIDATGGTYILTHGGQSTDAIAFDATAAEVQTALQALSTIGAGNCLVTGDAGGPYTVTFVGDLQGRNAAQLTSTDSLTGGAGTVTHATSTAGVDGGIETATVAADSTLAFTTLTTGAEYFAYAALSGAHRIVKFYGS